MGEIWIGAAGWSYSDWKGGFYPKTIPNNQFLKYYSHYFNFVEVNSSFYNTPSLDTVEGWMEQVPKNFGFSLKMWKELTHKSSKNTVEMVEEAITKFFIPLEYMFSNIKGIVMQFPPYFHAKEETYKYIKIIQKFLPPKYHYYWEFRHESWNDLNHIQNIINTESKNHFYLNNYQKEDNWQIQLPDQKKHYLRIIGDREITIFSHTQRQDEGILEKLKVFIEQKKDFSEIFVIFNNHFRGFSPADIMQLKKMLKIPQKSISKSKDIRDFF